MIISNSVTNFVNRWHNMGKSQSLVNRLHSALHQSTRSSHEPLWMSTEISRNACKLFSYEDLLQFKIVNNTCTFLKKEWRRHSSMTKKTQLCFAEWMTSFISFSKKIDHFVLQTILFCEPLVSTVPSVNKIYN